MDPTSQEKQGSVEGQNRSCIEYKSSDMSVLSADPVEKFKQVPG